MINKIRFKNFKLFKQEQTLKILPITILIGKNNTGKSAIAKLPSLIAGGLSGKFNFPLSPENEGISLGRTYEDLVYNKYPADSLEFDLFDELNELKVVISKDSKGKLPFFKKYSFNGKEYDIKKTNFKGLLHETLDNHPSLNLNYDYIGSIRKRPSENYKNIFEEFSKVGIEGENAYPILISLYENNIPLFTKISNWYKDNFENWGLGIHQVGGLDPSYEIALERKGLQPIPIANTGQGIQQAFPLVVRSFMPVENATLIVIEEPETHLHPAAHGNLAERFADSYLEDKKKFYLLETHSQNFVLRLRALVAKGKLRKEELAIYYVDFDEEKNESTIRLIEIDEYGNLPNDDWPEGIFNETSLEINTILKAQSRN